MKRMFALIAMSVLMLAVLVGCSSGGAGAGEQERLITVGIDDQFAPMGFRDANNEIVGFDIDLARAVIERMGGAIAEFQPIDWTAKESELASGRIDLIWNGYTITEERKEKVLFTRPYLENRQVAVTLQGANMAGLDDLAGKQVGLQALSSAADALNASALSAQVAGVTEFKDNVLALTDLENGRLDAVVIDAVVIDYYMTKKPDTFTVLEEALAPEQYGIGVKLGNEALLQDLQTAIDEVIADGTAAKISQQWFGEDRVLK